MSVRLGPETHIPKKTHTFSFQVSRNEGSVYLGTWGRGSLSDKQGQGQGPARAARAGAGQGKAARADTRPLFSVTDRAGQGDQGKHPPVVFSYTCIYRQTK